MNNKSRRMLFASAISVILVAVFAFFADEARKEIYFLCGNFNQGDSYSGVTKQLDTANLSGYQVVTTESGKRVIQSSFLHFHMLSCEINFDKAGVVTSASYR